MTTPDVPPIALAGEPVAWVDPIDLKELGHDYCIRFGASATLYPSQGDPAHGFVPLFAAPTPSASSVPVAIPDGYVLMPRALTAENGAKGLLSGEFAEHVEIQNPDYDDEDEDEGSDEPETHRVDVPVEWDTIKRIHAMAVEHLAAPPANTKTDWLPAADNINDLPAPVRDYIMGLETNCDPAGMVRENAILRHDNAEFESRLAANPAPSVLTDEQLHEMIVEACHSDPVMLSNEYCLTLDEVRALLQANGAKHD